MNSELKALNRLQVRLAVWYGLVLVAVHGSTFMATSYLALRQEGQVTERSFGGRERLVSDPTVAVDVPMRDVVASYLDYFRDPGSIDRAHVPGGQGVANYLIESAQRSLALLAAALVLAMGVGPLLGSGALDMGTGRVRPLALWLNLAGFAMPAFYVGIVGLQASFFLVRVTPLEVGLLPSMGYGLDRHLILPVIALALRPTSEIARLTAEMLSAEMSKDYVRTARAKGLPQRLIVFRHAWPNIGASVITAVGNAMRYLISSLVVVEALFSWPGLGRALAMALVPRIDGRPSGEALYDPHFVAAICAALAAIGLSISFATAVAARTVDPRLRT